MSVKNYDIVVIGGGWGGISAATKAASLGQKVLLVEKSKLGGLCLNAGCIPSKALLWVAKNYSHYQDLAKLGIAPAVNPSALSWQVTQAYAQKVVQNLTDELQAMLKRSRFEIAAGAAARFSSTNTVELTTGGVKETVEFRKAIIACGSAVMFPPIFENYRDQVLTNANIFSIAKLPQKILIVGAGAVGCEFASFFAHYGQTEVTLIEMKDQLVPGEDAWISQSLEQALLHYGIKIFKSTQVKAIDRHDGSWKVDFGSQSNQSFDHILLAAGRKLQASALGLENLPGLQFNAKTISVNSKLETTLNHIYAIGDANGLSLFAHAASAQGEIAAINACGDNKEFNPLLVPRCLYTQPEAASVGYFIRDLEQLGIEYKALRGSFSANSRAICEGYQAEQHPTRIQILIEKNSKKILGAQLLGPAVSETIHLFALALANNLTAEDVKKTIFAHPSFSESLGITIAKG